MSVAAASTGSGAAARPVALVTGASRGIGRAIARAFAAADYDLIAVGRSRADLDDLAGEVDGRCAPVIADLLDPAQIGTVADAARRAGSLAVCVNAAGMVVRSDPPDIQAADVDAVLALNVRAPLLVAQAVQPLLAEHNGCVINIASTAASTVTRAPVVYQASKAAVVQMTKALAVMWGPSVRVNAIGPGYVETDLNREWLADPANRAYISSRTALGRLGTVDDVSGVAVFLASPAAAYITGQHIVVDGGWNAR